MMLRNDALLNSVFFVLLLILLLPAAAGGAQAQDGTVIGSMVVDCSTLTGEALQYVQENGICNAASPNQGVVVNGVGSRTDNCGTVSIVVENDPQPDIAVMSMRAESSIGYITRVSYTIVWDNWDTAEEGEVNGGTWIHASNVYQSPTHYVDTGNSGNTTVQGTLIGEATVMFRITCVFLPATATARIK